VVLDHNEDVYEAILVSTDTPPGVVHRILGHANFATTVKLYGGVLPEALDSAAGKTGAAFETRPDKWFSSGQEMTCNSLKLWLPELESNGF
jgi:hypothetical protein